MTDCCFGDISHAETVGNDLVITGHHYVALAFNHDDPYLVTRLIGVVEEDLVAEHIKSVSSAGDIYECDIIEEQGRVTVTLVIGGSEEITFRCKEIIEEPRYYTRDEILDIFRWLPSQCTTAELQPYLRDIEAHGFSVTIANGIVTVEENRCRRNGWLSEVA